jgi:hypothetical protein
MVHLFYKSTILNLYTSAISINIEGKMYAHAQDLSMVPV